MTATLRHPPVTHCAPRTQSCMGYVKTVSPHPHTYPRRRHDYHFRFTEETTGFSDLPRHMAVNITGDTEAHILPAVWGTPRDRWCITMSQRLLAVTEPTYSPGLGFIYRTRLANGSPGSIILTSTY